MPVIAGEWVEHDPEAAIAWVRRQSSEQLRAAALCRRHTLGGILVGGVAHHVEKIIETEIERLELQL